MHFYNYGYATKAFHSNPITFFVSYFIVSVTFNGRMKFCLQHAYSYHIRSFAKGGVLESA